MNVRVLATIALGIASCMAPAIGVVWKGEMGGIPGMAFLMAGFATIGLSWLPRREWPKLAGVFLAFGGYLVMVLSLTLLNWGSAGAILGVAMMVASPAAFLLGRRTQSMSSS